MKVLQINQYLEIFCYYNLPHFINNYINKRKNLILYVITLILTIYMFSKNFEYTYATVHFSIHFSKTFRHFTMMQHLNSLIHKAIRIIKESFPNPPATPNYHTKIQQVYMYIYATACAQQPQQRRRTAKTLI